MAQAQGSLSAVTVHRETSFKTLPSAVAGKKCYFKTCSLGFTQNFFESEIIRGSSRHPSVPSRGTTDVAGDISTELNVDTFLWFAACGSMESAITGATMDSALTTPTAVIDSTNCTMTVTSTSHGLVAGDTIEITGITAPTSLNSKYFAVYDAPTADTFKVAIPIGTTSTFTLGGGAVKKVTAAGTTGTHTFKAGGALPSYTIEKGFTDIAKYFKYAGCKLSTITWNIPATGMVDVTSTWMGGSETTGTASFETGTVTDNGFAVCDAMHIAAADVKEGSTPSAIATIKSATITLDNQLDGDTFVIGGQGARAAINPGVYKVSGTLEVLFEDLTMYTKATAGTESGIDITFKRNQNGGAGDGTIGDESYQLVIPELIFVPKAPPIDGPKGIVASFDFTGYYGNHADATGLKIVAMSPVLPGAMV